MTITRKKIKITRIDETTHKEIKEVLDLKSEEYLNLVTQSIINKGKKEFIKGEYVDDDTPVGMVGKVKNLHYSRGKDSQGKSYGKYEDYPISYEIEEGIVRFVDFKPFSLIGRDDLSTYTFNRKSTDDGDLLEVDLRKSTFAVTDRQEVNRINYILSLVQKFNNEILSEAQEENTEETRELDMEEED